MLALPHTPKRSLMVSIFGSPLDIFLHPFFFFNVCFFTSIPHWISSSWNVFHTHYHYRTIVLLFYSFAKSDDHFAPTTETLPGCWKLFVFLQTLQNAYVTRKRSFHSSSVVVFWFCWSAFVILTFLGVLPTRQKARVPWYHFALRDLILWWPFIAAHSACVRIGMCCKTFKYAYSTMSCQREV